MNDNLALNRKTEIVVFLSMVVSILVFRIINLSADPPIGLTLSQSVYTDPAQYVSFARNYVNWGSFNPLHDFRLIFFLKSMTTILAVLVFKIIGVGYWQSNTVGLIFSFSTIIIYYFAIRRFAGNIAALFFLLFISLNYNQIHYGRLPFLENSLNFFVALSFMLMAYSKRFYGFFLSGICLGLGIFFGKIIGLLTLFPYFCYALYEYFFKYNKRLKEYFVRYGFFLIGFIIVLSAWYYISYQPASQAVEGYLEEQAFSLYGGPDGLNDLDTFVYSYVSFGAKSKLFSRMIVPSLFTICLILSFAYRAGFRRVWKKGIPGLNAEILFLITLIIAAYGALMIWNYRPLRYQLIMIYPICALAGIFIKNLLSERQHDLSLRGNYIYPILFFVVILVPIYQFLKPIYGYFDISFNYIETRTVVIVLAIMATISMVLFLRYMPVKIIKPPRLFNVAIIIAAMLMTLIPDTLRYSQAYHRAAFNTVANSRDLATILSPEAVISGPYAADFTLENKFMNLIHMFGVASVDSAFFERYPVTHLLLDKSNAERAKEDYPSIMDPATQLAKYNVGGREVLLFRVVGLTGNREADKYGLSPFEMGVYYFMNKNKKLGHQFMQLSLRKNLQNLNCNLAYAIIAKENDAYEDAENFFMRAKDFSPTDFRLRYLIGEFYIDMYNMTNDLKYKERALVEFNQARRFNYKSRKLETKIAEKLIPKGNN